MTKTIESTHHTIRVGDVSVRIDELNGHVGFGYCIGERTYTAAGFADVASAERAAPTHVRRTLAVIERARESNARRMRDLRTIRSW